MERGFVTRINPSPQPAASYKLALHTHAMSKYLNLNKEIQKQRQDLPHWQQGDVWVFLTWRLGDSIPKPKLLRWKEEKEAWLTHFPKPWDKETELRYHQRFGKMMDDWLDAGYGTCLLKKQTNAKVVANALLHFNDERYRLSDFVVMPNHVHALVSPQSKLGEIIKSWKTFTAKEINQHENRTGPLWQSNYWDRLIRSEEHFKQTQKYIQNNPRNLKPGSFLLWSAGL